jgi:hypothetical protein
MCPAQLASHGWAAGLAAARAALVFRSTWGPGRR